MQQNQKFFKLVDALFVDRVEHFLGIKAEEILKARTV